MRAGSSAEVESPGGCAKCICGWWIGFPGQAMSPLRGVELAGTENRGETSSDDQCWPCPWGSQQVVGLEKKGQEATDDFRRELDGQETTRRCGRRLAIRMLLGVAAAAACRVVSSRVELVPGPGSI